MCTEKDCLALYPFHFPSIVLPSLSTLFDIKAMAVYLVWFALQAGLYVVLPGEVHQGVVLSDGKTRLNYTNNGLLAFALSIAGCFTGHFFGLFNLVFVADHFLGLFMSATVVSYILSIYLYKRSFTPGVELARGVNFLPMKISLLG